MLVYKSFSSCKSSYFAKNMISNKQMRTTRSSLKVKILDVHSCDDGSTAKACIVDGPRLRNNTLDDKLRGCKNVELFKKKK